LQGGLPVLQGDGGSGRGQEDGLVNYNLKNVKIFCCQDFSYLKKIRFIKTTKEKTPPFIHITQHKYVQIVQKHILSYLCYASKHSFLLNHGISLVDCTLPTFTVRPGNMIQEPGKMLFTSTPPSPPELLGPET
jgi:hypothetical protein